MSFPGQQPGPSEFLTSYLQTLVLFSLHPIQFSPLHLSFPYFFLYSSPFPSFHPLYHPSSFISILIFCAWWSPHWFPRGNNKGRLLSSLPCMSKLDLSSLLARLWSALLPLPPLLSPDLHPLPQWSSKGFTLSNLLPYLKLIWCMWLTNHRDNKGSSIAEMLVKFCQTTWHNNPEDSHPHENCYIKNYKKLCIK
jgi:hypothetical protein